MKIIVLMKQVANKDAVLRIEVDRSNLDGNLRLKRELESGWYQWFTYKLPALLTIQSGISQIRYASLKGIMAAKKKEIRDVAPAVESSGSAQRIEKVYLPLKTKQTQMLGDGDAKRGAAELVEKLKTEVRVL
jgi:electron transfer flavoprotein beta subunit